MQVVTNWMNNVYYIERYAWFGCMRNLNGIDEVNRLMTTDGQQRTALGNRYILNGGQN